MELNTHGLVHVVFELSVVDGWPPVSGERVWAEPQGDHLYRLVNVPWFAPGVAEDDIVRAVPPDDDSWPVYIEKVTWSGNYTIWVIPHRDGPLCGSQTAVLDIFSGLGASGEGAGSYPIVALTIPPNVDLPAIKAVLIAGQQDRSWDYAEGCIDDIWRGI